MRRALPPVSQQSALAAQDAPLRVMMVAHSHSLGGMERHVVALSGVLAAHGHTVAFAGPMDGWLGEQMRAAGHVCHHVPLNGMYDVYSMAKLTRFANAFQPDVLHGHSQRGARYAAWAGWWVSKAAVATAHSTDSNKWFRKKTHVIAVSGAVKAALIAAGLAPEQVHVVHLGVSDVKAVTPPQGGDITPQRPLVLGLVARVEHVKGHDLALRALAMLREDLPARLVIVGDHGNEWGRYMQSLAEELGVTGVVDFLGQRSDIAALMHGFDVVLAPSRREALNLSLIEAAASARPAVGSQLGGIPEVILDGRTGLLFPPENVPALASAVRHLADPQLRVAYGLAARQYYECEFTMEAMYSKTLQVYGIAIAAMR